MTFKKIVIILLSLSGIQNFSLQASTAKPSYRAFETLVNRYKKQPKLKKSVQDYYDSLETAVDKQKADELLRKNNMSNIVSSESGEMSAAAAQRAPHETRQVKVQRPTTTAAVTAAKKVPTRKIPAVPAPSDAPPQRIVRPQTAASRAITISTDISQMPSGTILLSLQKGTQPEDTKKIAIESGYTYSPQNNFIRGEKAIINIEGKIIVVTIMDDMKNGKDYVVSVGMYSAMRPFSAQYIGKSPMAPIAKQKPTAQPVISEATPAYILGKVLLKLSDFKDKSEMIRASEQQFGYYFDAYNRFSPSEEVLVQNEKGDLVMGKIDQALNDGAYMVRINNGNPKIIFPRLIGKNPKMAQIAKEEAMRARTPSSKARITAETPPISAARELRAPQIGKIIFAPVKGDDKNLTKVITKAKGAGYSFAPTNDFKIDQEVLVPRVSGDKKGALTLGVIVEQLKTGEYTVRAEPGQGEVGTKTLASQFIGQFPVQPAERPMTATIARPTGQTLVRAQMQQKSRETARPATAVVVKQADVIGKLKEAQNINLPGIKQLDKTTYASFINALNEALALIQSKVPYNKPEAQSIVQTTMQKRYKDAKLTHDSQDRFAPGVLDQLIAVSQWARKITDPVLAKLRDLNLMTEDLYQKFIQLRKDVDTKLEHFKTVERVGTVVRPPKVGSVVAPPK